MVLTLFLITLLLCVAHWIYVRMRGEFGFDPPAWLEAYRLLVHLSEEGNLPTSYSTMLWLLSATLAWIAAATETRGSGRGWRWILLSVLFLYLGLDEGAQLHDRAGAITDAWFSGFREGYSWVVPGAMLVLLALIAFGRFILELPPMSRLAFFIGGATFVCGALGMELLEIYTLDDPTRLPAWLNDDRRTLLEEGFEMTGLVINVLALLLYLKTRPGLVLRVQ